MILTVSDLRWSYWSYLSPHYASASRALLSWHRRRRSASRKHLRRPHTEARHDSTSPKSATFPLYRSLSLLIADLALLCLTLEVQRRFWRPIQRWWRWLSWCLQLWSLSGQRWWWVVHSVKERLVWRMVLRRDFWGSSKLMEGLERDLEELKRSREAL